MKYIASCSFGKDSLAMILAIIEHGLPLDEVVYCEVMYDSTTSGEYPEHADFIHNKAIPILELVYGLKVSVIRADTNYKEQFYRPRTKGERIGQAVGFPTLWSPWCNGCLKRKPMQDYRASQSEPLHEYVGSADSLRYKALGNSIALPPWAYVLTRLSLCAAEEPTMASLFDGIGGFPLIWEWLNGKGSCLWASEIEDFPIAVTKEHFPDEAPDDDDLIPLF